MSQTGNILSLGAHFVRIKTHGLWATRNNDVYPKKLQNTKRNVQIT